MQRRYPLPCYITGERMHKSECNKAIAQGERSKDGGILATTHSNTVEPSLRETRIFVQKSCREGLGA